MLRLRLTICLGKTVQAGYNSSFFITNSYDMSQILKLYWHYFLPKYILTLFAGFMANNRLPWLKNYLIQDFLTKYPVNMQEALETNPRSYENFNAFFTRKLKPNARPMAKATYIIPADGFISQAGPIHEELILQAKGKDYAVNALIANHKLAQRFNEGAFATIYLSPKDYHRIHMPIDGQLISQTYIPGKLFSVQPFTTENIPNLFTQNERLVLHFETTKGPMMLILVGATIVGTIGTSWQGDLKRSKKIEQIDYSTPIELKQGDEVGYFKLGSTVIMLFSHRPQWLTPIESGTPTKWGEALAE
jgi:phosphatidylserine decarboxylase